MRCTTTFKEVLSHRGTLLLMLRKSSGNMLAGLTNIYGTASVTCNFIYHMGFQDFLSKDDFRVGKQFRSFLVVKMIWISLNFFSLLAKFLVMFPLYWTKNLGLGSLLLRFLTFLRCCWVLGFAVTFFFFISSNVSLTILEDHSVGYWYWVQISWFFLRATSKDCQSLVVLKILCTVLWITFFLCCSSAQLGKFRTMPVSVDFWYQWQLFLSSFDFMLDIGMPGLHYRLVSQKWIVSSCEENLHIQGNLEGSLWRFILCHSTYLLNRSKQFPAWSYTLSQWYLGTLHKTVFAWFALDPFPSESNAPITVKAYHLCVKSFVLPSLIWFLRIF